MVNSTDAKQFAFVTKLQLRNSSLHILTLNSVKFVENKTLASCSFTGSIISAYDTKLVE